MTLAEFFVDADRVFDVDLGAFHFDIEKAVSGLFELDAYCYGIAFEVGLIKVGIRAARREAGQASRMDDFPFLVKGVAEGLGAHLGDLNRGVQATERPNITNRWRSSDWLGGLGGGGLGGGVSSLGLSGVSVLVVEGVCSIASTGALASVLAGVVVSLVLASETPSVSVGRLVTGGLTPPPIVELIARPPRVVVREPSTASRSDGARNRRD